MFSVIEPHPISADRTAPDLTLTLTLTGPVRWGTSSHRCLATPFEYQTGNITWIIGIVKGSNCNSFAMRRSVQTFCVLELILFIASSKDYLPIHPIMHLPSVSTKLTCGISRQPINKKRCVSDTPDKLTRPPVCSQILYVIVQSSK
jgi:hypothetical protein